MAQSLAADRTAVQTSTQLDLALSDTHSADGDSEKPFRFFDLPRELRNVIYSELPQSTMPAGLGKKLKWEGPCIEPFCMPPLRLANRQFKAEYEEETFRQAQTTVRAHVNSDMDICSVLNDSMWFKPMLQHVTISLVPDDSAWSLVPTYTQRQVADLVATLPALRTLKLEFRGFLNDFEEFVAGLSLNARKTFATQTLAGIPSTVQVEKVLLLYTILYLTNAELCDNDPDLSEWLCAHDNNVICYSATPTSDPHSWYGMELATDSYGEVNMKDLMLEYACEEELRMLENDGDDEYLDELADELLGYQDDDDEEEYDSDAEWD